MSSATERTGRQDAATRGGQGAPAGKSTGADGDEGSRTDGGDGGGSGAGDGAGVSHAPGDAVSASGREPTPTHTSKAPSVPHTPAMASSPPASVVHSTVSTALGNTSGSSLGIGSLDRSSMPGFKLTEFNAISTVLNHPTRRQPPIDPNSSRYAAINLSHTDLPKVKKADYQAYLNEVTPEYNRYVRSQRVGANGKAAVSRASIDASRGSIAGPSSSPSGADTPKRRLPSLSSVPQVFFAEDFELGNPYTFDLVTERYKASSTLTPGAASERTRSSDKLMLGGRSSSLSAGAGKSTGLATSGGNTFDVALNQMLQEKLSYYSDVVEQHLILEISARSSSFFAALGNLQDLSSQAEACLAKISELRSELVEVDEKHAKKGLRIVHAQSKAQEIQRKEAALLALREMVERRDMARLLVEQAEYDDALEMITQLRRVLNGQWPVLDGAEASKSSRSEVDLSQVKALKSIPQQLDELEDVISTALIQQLISILAADILERIGSPEDVANDTVAPPPAVPEKELPPPPKEPARTRRGHARLGSLARKSLSESIGFGASKLNSAPKGGAEDSPRPSLDAPSTPTTAEQATLTAPPIEKVATALAPSSPTVPYGASANASRRELEPVDSDLRARIAPLIVGLVRTGGVERAMSSYRDEAVKAVRSVVHSHVTLAGGELAKLLDEDDATKVAALQREWSGAGDGSDGAGSGSGPIEQLRKMSHDDFLNVGHAFFEGLLLAITAVDAQCKLILQILDECDQGALNGRMAEVQQQASLSSPTLRQPPSPSMSVAEREPNMPAGVPASLPSSLADIIYATAEMSHSRASRLVGLRSATHAQLNLRSFLALFQLCWSFVLRSELISRRMIIGLRGAVLGQAKAFLATFHRQRIESAAKVVEEETWTPVEVAESDVQRVKMMVRSAVDDPPELIVSTADELILARRNSTAAAAAAEAGTSSKDAASAQPEHANGDSATASADQRGQAAEGAQKDKPTETMFKTLDVEDRQYYVVSASLQTLKLLSEYLRVVINLPLLTMEAMTRVVEFLKQFNSRTCQVVLGAGAMRSAGLKNITAKHLALASQSLSIMITLIPYIREAVRRHLSPKQAVMLTEFDKLRRDMQEHQYEIHSKLVAIMGDRLTVHSRSLSTLDWNKPIESAPAKDGEQEGDEKSATPEAHKYVKDLGQETATLNKVLVRYLHAQTVEQIMSQVLVTIQQRLSSEYDKLTIETDEAKARLRADAAFLDKKMSALKNLEWSGDAIHKVVEEKCKTPPPRPPSPPKKAPQPAYKPRISPFAFGRRQTLQQRLQQQEQQRQQQQEQEQRQSQDTVAKAPVPPETSEVPDKGQNESTRQDATPTAPAAQSSAGEVQPPPPEKDTPAPPSAQPKAPSLEEEVGAGEVSSPSMVQEPEEISQSEDQPEATTSDEQAGTDEPKAEREVQPASTSSDAEQNQGEPSAEATVSVPLTAVSDNEVTNGVGEATGASQDAQQAETGAKDEAPAHEDATDAPGPADAVAAVVEAPVAPEASTEVSTNEPTLSATETANPATESSSSVDVVVTADDEPVGDDAAIAKSDKETGDEDDVEASTEEEDKPEAKEAEDGPAPTASTA